MVLTRRRTSPRGTPAAGAGRRPADDGSVALEAVILFPIVLLLVMTTIQAGVYYHARNTAQNAANGAVMVGAGTGGTTTAAQNEARDRLDRAGGSSLLTGSTVTATRTTTDMTVTVKGEAVTFVPGLPPLTVSSTVTAPVEQFTTASRP